MDNFFTEEFLKGCTFRNGTEAYQVIKHQAHLYGFDICSRYNINSDYPKFYCKMGRKRNQNSQKSSCGFNIRLRPKDTKDTSKGLVISKCCLSHNHDLDPGNSENGSSNGDYISSIKTLFDSGCSMNVIQSFALKQHSMFLSYLDIYLISCEESVMRFSSQANNLIEYVRSEQGTVFTYENNRDGQSLLLGVITQTMEESSNIRRYMDSVFLEIHNLGCDDQWIMVSITMLNGNGDICSGGMMFLPFLSDTLIKWLIIIIINEFRDTQLKSIITRNDPVIVSAINDILQNEPQSTFKHILCAREIQSNFKEKLKGINVKKVETRTRLKKLFERVCYSDNKKIVLYSITKICETEPLLAKYLKKHIDPFIPQFSWAYLSSVFCCGQNTLCPNDDLFRSLHTFLKNKLCDLQQYRVFITDCLICLKTSQEMSLSPGYLEYNNDNAIKLPLKIRESINDQIQKSQNFVIEPIADEQWTVFDPHTPHIKYILDQNFVCSCGLSRNCGIPCSHVIAFGINQEQVFPYFLVSNRWHITDDYVSTQIPSNEFIENNVFLFFNEYRRSKHYMIKKMMKDLEFVDEDRLRRIVDILEES